MSFDVLVSGGFEVVPAAELQQLFLHENELFGSPSDGSTVTTEEDDVVFSSDSPPRDTSEEWPASRQIRSFYFVRNRRYDDKEIKAKIDLADKELYRCNLARIQITSELKVKRAERSDLFVQLEILRAEHEAFNAIFDEKKKEMEQEALQRQWGYGGGLLCSSQKELDGLIYSLEYRIQHENISLAEENQLLEEIKQLKGTCEKVVDNSTVIAKVQDSPGEQVAMQNMVVFTHVDMDEVKKGQKAVAARINCLNERLRAIKMEMDLLEVELMSLTDKRDKAFETITTLRKQRDHENATFFESIAVLTKGKELAANGNVKALEELANSEVEKFMSLWNSNKAFRDDYEKRILPSLDARHLSRDGRNRDSVEELLVASETSFESGMNCVARAGSKRGREDSVSSSSQDSSVVSYESKKEAGRKCNYFIKSTSEDSDGMDLDISSCAKLQNEEKIDDEKLKEKKRQEELAKAQQAMERKRRLQEKAAAKAAIRAQKEAEKKLKEREKKAKKKAATSSPPLEREETPETVMEPSEPEKAEADSSLSSAKEKLEKERSVISRHRSFRYRHQAKEANALLKAVIKRRRAANYWFWTMSSAAFALVLLLVTCIYVH